jgi:heme oxygenase
VTPQPPLPFSKVLRAASLAEHDEASGASFMTDLLGGALGVEAYARYTEQLWFVYRALEESAGPLAADPLAGPFIRPELPRVAALEHDLDLLLGAGWRQRAVALPATARYAERVAQVAREWPAGYVAHHYTRYLGDLSGGQLIRDMAERTWGFQHKGDGVRFYVYEAIGNPAAFKRDYRERLNELGAAVDELERQRVVAECRDAYSLNTAVFRALGEVFTLTA